MNFGLSDQVRSMAVEKYVTPAIHAGKTRFSVAVRDLMNDLQSKGFPPRNWPQICSAIQAGKFLRAHGLEIEAVDGPPKKQSSTVVVRYRIVSAETQSASGSHAIKEQKRELLDETPEARSRRLVGKLFGLMKDEIAAHGGAEGYMRWVRSEDEDPE